MTSLFIYDNNGTVVSVLCGVGTVPAGVQSVVADKPDRMKACHVNTQTKAVEFELYPDTESEVTNLQNGMAELDQRVSELEGN